MTDVGSAKPGWRAHIGIALGILLAVSSVSLIVAIVILFMPIYATASDTGMRGKTPLDFSCGTVLDLLQTNGAHPSGIPEFGRPDRKALASCNAQYNNLRPDLALASGVTLGTILASGGIVLYRRVRTRRN
jgi:hypothetical protein